MDITINYDCVDGYCKDVGETFRWVPNWQNHDIYVYKNAKTTPELCGGGQCYEYQLDFYKY